MLGGGRDFDIGKESSPSGLAFSADGRFLFVTLPTKKIIETLSIESSDGSINSIGLATSNGTENDGPPSSISIVNNIGRLGGGISDYIDTTLLVTHTSSNTISRHYVTSDGLILGSEQPVLGFTNLNKPVAITTLGDLILVGNAGNNTITIYKITDGNSVKLFDTIKLDSAPSGIKVSNILSYN